MWRQLLTCFSLLSIAIFGYLGYLESKKTRALGLRIAEVARARTQPGTPSRATIAAPRNEVIDKGFSPKIDPATSRALEVAQRIERMLDQDSGDQMQLILFQRSLLASSWQLLSHLDLREEELHEYISVVVRNSRRAQLARDLARSEALSAAETSELSKIAADANRLASKDFLGEQRWAIVEGYERDQALWRFVDRFEGRLLLTTERLLDEQRQALLNVLSAAGNEQRVNLLPSDKLENLRSLLSGEQYDQLIKLSDAIDAERGMRDARDRILRETKQ